MGSGPTSTTSPAATDDKAGPVRALDDPPELAARIPAAVQRHGDRRRSRRQRRHVQLHGLAQGGTSSVPADARALARLHLKEIASRITKVLETRNLAIDDTSRAHLEECRHRIAKVLEANLDMREP